MRVSQTTLRTREGTKIDLSDLVNTEFPSQGRLFSIPTLYVCNEVESPLTGFNSGTKVLKMFLPALCVVIV